MFDCDKTAEVQTVLFRCTFDSSLTFYARALFICDCYWSKNIAYWIENHENNTFSLISPSAAYMRQWIGSTLVRIMACCLFGVKPLSKPMLSYCQVDPNFSEISIKIQNISFVIMHLKISSAECQPFCLGLNVLNKGSQSANPDHALFEECDTV